MVCRVRPEKRDEYLALHSPAWPEVEAMNSAAGIRNFTIFIRDDVLFGYYEYVGDDYEGDQARMAANPRMQEWWALTEPCQYGFDEDSPAYTEEQIRDYRTAYGNVPPLV